MTCSDHPTCVLEVLLELRTENIVWEEVGRWKALKRVGSAYKGGPSNHIQPIGPNWCSHAEPVTNTSIPTVGERRKDPMMQTGYSWQSEPRNIVNGICASVDGSRAPYQPPLEWTLTRMLWKWNQPSLEWTWTTDCEVKPTNNCDIFRRVKRDDHPRVSPLGWLRQFC